MKRIIALALCLIIGSAVVFGQEVKDENVKSILEKNEQREVYQAKLEDSMLGFRMGAEYSLRSFNTIGVVGATKHGVHIVAGYRFTKHWYVGGIVGADITTPFVVTNTEEGYYNDPNFNYYYDRDDIVYIPVIADIRYYFNVKKVSTYLFANLGAEFSTITATIASLGIGFDIHTTKDQCVNVGLGLGLGSWMSGETTYQKKPLELDPVDGFVFNLKVGYSF